MQLSGHFQGVAVVPRRTKADTTKKEAGWVPGPFWMFWKSKQNLLPSPVKQLGPLEKPDNETNILCYLLPVHVYAHRCMVPTEMCLYV